MYKIMKRGTWFVILALVLTLAASPAGPSAWAKPTQVIRYVALNGTDTSNTCAASATPCATLQHAVDVSTLGDEIRMAAGVYPGVTARAGIYQAAYIDKSVIVRGGYSLADWNTSYPITQPTTLDALGQGRGIYITGTITPTLDGLNITGGNAVGMGGDPEIGAGGGVYVGKAYPTLNGLQIYNNWADLGGGVYMYNAGGLVTATLISGNLASDGAGVYLAGTVSTWMSNTIRSNTSTPLNGATGTGGGGMYLYYDQSSLISNTVQSNSTLGSGGGMFLILSTAMVTGTIIEGNSARDGGGLYARYDTSPSVIYNQIRNNTATPVAGQGGVGGGVLLDFDSLTWVNKNVIVGNSAAVGGGLAMIHSNATASGNLVQSNTAVDGSGAFLLYHSDGWLVNDAFVDNRVSGDNYGNGVSIAGSQPRLVYDTIARNSGDGVAVITSPGSGCGSYCYALSQTDVRHAISDRGLKAAGAQSLISNPTLTNMIIASQGRGVYVAPDSQAVIDHVLWYNNAVDTLGPAIVTNEFTGDPLFGADGYHIMAGSAARDRAINTTTSVDIDLEFRPFGPAPDLGADEFDPVAPASVTLSGPTAGFAPGNFTFVATVSPITASVPLSFTWLATGQPAMTLSNNQATLIWADTVSGAQQLTVTVSNSEGSATQSYTVQLMSRSLAPYHLYLPAVLR